MEVEWKGRTLVVRRPEPLGDVHFLTVAEWSDDASEAILDVSPTKEWDIAVRFDGGDYVREIFPQIVDGIRCHCGCATAPASVPPRIG